MSVGRGLCRKHYMRVWRNGTIQTKRLTLPGEPENFIQSLPLRGTGCIFWPFARNNRGYGQINILNSGKKALAHRIICQKINGNAPSKDYLATHDCGNGHLGCVAPWHLSWKTAKGNSADALRHGTISRGEKHSIAGLKDADIRKIRNLAGNIPQSKIAKIYNCSQSAISKIVLRKIWAHVQ